MNPKRFPDWLTYFDMVIQTSDRVVIFSKYQGSPNNIKFDDGDGFVLGSLIFIENIKYKVSEMHVYCSQEIDKMSFRLDVFVEEISR